MAAGLLTLVHCAPTGQGVHSAHPVASSAEPAPRGLARPGTPPEVDIARARANGQKQSFVWHKYEKASFELAAREKKLVLLEGAAAWCHWCHVMDETTYKDAEVGKLLSDRFVAIRVDIDENPEIAERYGDWGWPATILLSADGKELGKFRGYLPKDELVPALTAAISGGADDAPARQSPASNHVASAAELPWAIAFAVHTIDEYYDDELGGWGKRQKAPMGENLELEARRALRGDDVAKKHVLQTAAAQRNLLDPVWGGVYQYSEGGTWTSPHFEKLMTYQAENLAAYAMGYRATKDAALLIDAEAVASYMTTFLSGQTGGFYVSQDADVGAHDDASFFVDGHVYYEKSDAERRKLGMPRIDENVYAFENGLAIASLVAFHEASGKAEPLAKARRAADLLLRTHVKPDGRVRHAEDERAGAVFHLADAASFGLALANLARVTGDSSYREAALRIAHAMERDFSAGDGPLYAATADPGAVGVFSERRKPFDMNLLAVRFYAELAKLTADAKWKTRGAAILAGLSSPRGIEGQGRMIAGYLPSADDLGLLDPVLGK